jgi:arginase
MVLGRLLGLEPGWPPLLRPEQLFYVGLSSVDPPEQFIIDKLEIPHITAAHVSQMSPNDIVGAIEDELGHFDNIHVSFDVDVASKSGTGTPVVDSMDESQALEIARAIGDTLGPQIVGVDCVELNVRDFPSETALPFARNFLWNLLETNL